MPALTISSRFTGVALLVIFVLAGKVFRDNWKNKGKNWKRNCWLSGLIATFCFLTMAFIPFMPQV